MNRLIAALAACLALSACATTGADAPPEPRVVTVEVPVPTPVQCRPNIGPEPEYPDTDEALRAAQDLFERVKLLLAGRIVRAAREAELNAALRECRG